MKTLKLQISTLLLGWLPLSLKYLHLEHLQMGQMSTPGLTHRCLEAPLQIVVWIYRLESYSKRNSFISDKYYGCVIVALTERDRTVHWIGQRQKGASCTLKWTHFSDKYHECIFACFVKVVSAWHEDVARFMVEHGANLNQADNYGRTPLHMAVAMDYVDMVNFLIENGGGYNTHHHLLMCGLSWANSKCQRY